MKSRLQTDSCMSEWTKCSGYRGDSSCTFLCSALEEYFRSFDMDMRLYTAYFLHGGGVVFAFSQELFSCLSLGVHFTVTFVRPQVTNLSRSVETKPHFLYSYPFLFWTIFILL